MKSRADENMKHEGLRVALRGNLKLDEVPMAVVCHEAEECVLVPGFELYLKTTISKAYSKGLNRRVLTAFASFLSLGAFLAL